MNKIENLVYISGQRPEPVESVVENEADYFSLYQQIDELSKTDIEFSKPLLYLNETPLLYEKSILTIQGSKGSYKSTFAEYVLAKLIQENYFVILLDTERSIREQLPSAVKRIKCNAGFETTETVQNFFFTSNISTPRPERLSKFKTLISTLRDQNPDKTFVVCVDVLTDLTSNFNDVVESMELLDYLNLLINDFSVSVIGIIHQNPSQTGDQKARGHVGTELINKSSTVIKVEKDKNSELIIAKYLHLRNHKEPSQPTYFEYDQSLRGLVLVEPETVEERISKDNELLINLIYELLIIQDRNQSELVNKISSVLNISKNTVINRIKSLLNSDILGCKLSLRKDGNKNIYSLKSMEMNC